MSQIILEGNSTSFGQFLCPSSGAMAYVIQVC